MKAKELKQKTKEELELMLKESREKLRQMKFDIAAGKLKDSSQLGKTRQLIARLLTIKSG